MPISVACTQCKAALKLADTLAGKKVKCPKCKEIFLAAAGVAKTSAIAKGPPASAAKRQAPAVEKPEPRSKRRRDEESDDEPRSGRSSRKRQKAGANHLLLALGSGGGVLVVGIVILFIVMSMRSKPAVAEPPAVAKAKPAAASTPPPAGNEEKPAAPEAPPETPQPAATQPAPAASAPGQPAPQPSTPAPTQPPVVAAKGLQPGAKITVRTQIQGTPPGYNGDINKEVKQAVENALTGLGYQPAPEGSGALILQINAQMAVTGNKIQARVPGPARPAGKGKIAAPQLQTVFVPEQEMIANIVVTDDLGANLWKNNNKILSHNRNFQVNPALEMQAEIWTAFATWIKGPAMQNMK
jgi:phage FluMu protein Com